VTALASLMRLINLVNRVIGNVFMWLAVAIVVVCFWVVVERYVFMNTRLWMQDLYPWMNGVMFTAVAAMPCIAMTMSGWTSSSDRLRRGSRHGLIFWVSVFS